MKASPRPASTLSDHYLMARVEDLGEDLGTHHRQMMLEGEIDMFSLATGLFRQSPIGTLLLDTFERSGVFGLCFGELRYIGSNLVPILDMLNDSAKRNGKIFYLILNPEHRLYRMLQTLGRISEFCIHPNQL